MAGGGAVRKGREVIRNIDDAGISTAREPRLAVLPDREALAVAAARIVVDRAARAISLRGFFTLVLAGGSTPRDLYRVLADPTRGFSAHLPWQHIHLFWGDERHVPPEHPESNYRMARETLIDAVPVPPQNVHRIPAEEPEAARAAARYEGELRSFFAGAALPRFDLVLLGLGADGHTASLFPHSPALAERARWVAAPWVEALAAFRITLTPPVIDRAACVLFLVAGEDKAAAVRAVLEDDGPPAARPARIVRPADGLLLWRIERAAARELSNIFFHER
jgi:6-phosphogluconolactonase